MGDAASSPKISMNLPNNVFLRSLAKSAKEVRPVPFGSDMDCACLACCKGTAVAAAGAACGVGRNCLPLPEVFLSEEEPLLLPPPCGKIALNTEEARVSTSLRMLAGG